MDASLRPAPANSPYLRHALPVRIMHWVNVVALTVLFMSGLNIFDAYPELHWGRSSYNGREPLLANLLVEYLHQIGGLDGLHEMHVKSRFMRAASIFGTSVTGECDEQNRVPVEHGAYASRDFVPIEIRQPEID